MRIAIGSDHAGYQLKDQIKTYLSEKGHEIQDVGTFSGQSVNYPEYAHPVAQLVEGGDYRFGIVICGSGNGVAMTANKHQGIRCALCWNPEVSSLARAHNDSNICALPARFIDFSTAVQILENFISTAFEGGRHQIRVEGIPID